MVIKYRLLKSLPSFQPTIARNFPDYDYATSKNIGSSVPLIGMKFLT
jgi:hypothetical protein